MEQKFIMLIEDNPDDTALMLRAFKKNDIKHDVIILHDGEDAIDWINMTGKHSTRNPEALPSLILLDLKLPKYDGIEVLRKIRTNDSTRLLPVVILSSSREHNDIRQCYYSGCNAYVRKQLDFDKFIEAVNSICSFWLDLNETP
jgi:two-component system response regulator